MNIACISHLFPTEASSIQGKFIKDQLELLYSSAHDINIDLFVPTPHAIPMTKRGKENSSSLRLTAFNQKRVKYLSFPKKRLPKIIQRSLSSSLEKELSQQKFDLIHTHFLFPSALAIPLIKKLGYKTLLTIHGGDYYRIINKKSFSSIIENIFESVDKILLVGPKLLTDISLEFPKYKEKYRQINNLIDQEAYTLPSRKEKHETKRNLGWSTNKKHFLCIANNRPEKGLDILFETISRIKDLKSQTMIHVIGNLQDGFRDVDLVSNDMINVLDPVSPLELIEYYHASDAYLLPSRNEGFGLAMIEAACTGIPTVANPAGIASSFINDETGVLSESFSPESFENAIRKILLEIENFEPEKIRANVISRFGKKVFLENLTSIYQEVIESKFN